MSNINRVFLSGNLTRDPQARGGGTVAALSIASNRNFRKDDEWQTKTTYVDATCFGHNATRCIEKLQKGDPVSIEGSLELNEYENSDGEKRRQLRIVVNSIESPCFTAKLRRAYRAVQAEAEGDLPTSATNGDPQGAYVNDEPEAVAVASNGQPVEDDDIPF